VEEGSEVRVGRLVGRVLFIPGHTRGHVAYLLDGCLFCGDTLFAGGCGRVFEGTHEEMFRSLSRLRDLSPETLVYCGHEYTEKNLQFALTLEPGNPRLQERYRRVRELRSRGLPTVPSTLAEERETNPFLRWESREIQESLKRLEPAFDPSPAGVFRLVRNRKDRF
jgi:hydroxyacylglutathione hydrolase